MSKEIYSEEKKIDDQVIRVNVLYYAHKDFFAISTTVSDVLSTTSTFSSGEYTTEGDTEFVRNGVIRKFISLFTDKSGRQLAKKRALDTAKNNIEKKIEQKKKEKEREREIEEDF